MLQSAISWRVLGFPGQNTKPCPVFRLMDTHCEFACFGGIQQVIEFDVGVGPNFSLNGIRDRIVQGQSRRSVAHKNWHSREGTKRGSLRPRESRG